MLLISSQKVQDAMRRLGLSRNELAVKTGVDRKTASRILRAGPNGCPAWPATARKLAKGLGVDPADLTLEPEGHPPRDTPPQRRELSRIAEEVWVGHFEAALERAFCHPHLAHYRNELLQHETQLAGTQVQHILGDSTFYLEAQRRFTEWITTRTQQLSALDDVALSRLYTPTCRHNVPASRLLALRPATIEKCLGNLRDNAAAVLVLAGGHGKGKSSLAIQVARRAAHLALYDTILWVDFRTGASWDRVLRTYQHLHPGYAPRTPNGQEQVVELLHHISVTGERMLAVLDNWDVPECDPLPSFVSAASESTHVLITTTAKALAERLGLTSSQLFQPNLSWLLDDFLTLVAWFASKDDALVPLATGARVAHDLLGSGLERYLRTFEPHPDYSTQQRQLAANAVDLCENVFHRNPKLLNAALPELRRVARIDRLDPVSSDALEQIMIASKPRWQALTDAARRVASLLVFEQEGMSEGLLRALSGLRQRDFEEALGALDQQGFLEEDLASLNRERIHRLHTIERAVIETSLKRRPLWTHGRARRVLRFLDAKEEAERARRLADHTQTFVRAIVTLSKESSEEAALALLKMTSVIKSEGLWECGWSAARVCYSAMKGRHRNKLRVRLGIDILAWVAFWRSEFRECMCLLEEIEPLAVEPLDALCISLRRAHCWLHLDRHDAARQLLKKAMTAEVVKKSVPSQIDVYQVQTQLEIMDGKFAQAIEWSKKARARAHSGTLSSRAASREQMIALYYQAEAERLSGRAQDAWNTIWEADALNAGQHVPSAAYQRLCMAQCECALGFRKGVDFALGCLREARDTFTRMVDRVHLRQVDALLAALPHV